MAQFGEILIDFDRMELRRSGREIPATYLEFKVLRYLVDNPQRVFSRDDLLRAVWPQRRRATGRTVDTAISHLRRKLEEDPARPVYLLTVYRVPATSSYPRWRIKTVRAARAIFRADPVALLSAGMIV